MSHHLLSYALAPDYLERRPAWRDKHLASAWAAAERGDLLLGGAVGDPPEAALLLFTSDAAARAFAVADPYVTQGLVSGWTVRPWITVVGAGAATPVRPQLEEQAMPHVLLIGTLAADYFERRDPHKAAHMQHVWAAMTRGDILFGSVIGDPLESSLYLFRSEAAARAFAEADPYVLEGLVTEWRTVPWVTVPGPDGASPIPA